MKEKYTPKISNVFIEIIILIIFFSMASVIIFRIYAVTITNNYESTIKNNAIVNSNSIIALFKNGADIDECLKKTMDDVKVENYDNKYVVTMNEDFSSNKNGVVTMVIETNRKNTADGFLESINLKYYYYDSELYCVEGKKYEEK